MQGQKSSEKQSPTLLRRFAHGGAQALTGVIFIGFMVAGIGALHNRANAELPPDPNPALAVSAKLVQFAEGYEVTETFVGKLEPRRQTELAFERGGLVLDLVADEGDRVAAGAVIARLDTSQLKTRRLQLEAEGRELKARRDLAAATHTRQGSLKSKGWSTGQRYDEALFRLNQIDAGIERVDAMIKSIDIDLEKSEIKAPFSGVIAERSVDEGAVVRAGSQVMTLLEADHRLVRVGVSIEAAGQVEEGVQYSFQSNGIQFSGRLETKRPDLKLGSQTVTLLFEVSGADKIPFGEIVELTMRRSVKSEGAWLPVAALSESQKGLWTVFTVNSEEDVVEREAVEILHAEGERVFVRGTFKEGAPVILMGKNRVIPGQQVTLLSEE